MLMHLLLFLLCLSTGKCMQRNHQQVINEAPSTQGLSNNDILTRAIDQTAYKKDGGKKLGYVFTANFCPKLLPINKPCNHTLLVKLHSNLPNSSPFQIMWAKRYFDPNLAPTLMKGIMDVYDVKDTYNGYILCGRYGDHDLDRDPVTGDPYGAFMLLTDTNGNVQKFMIYQEIHVLYSVADFGKDSITKKQGFFAVGRSSSKERVFKATLLRTKYNLDSICQQNVEGVPSTNQKILESTFRWVIQSGKYFAMVGHTNYGGDVLCRKDSDVLFAMANAECGIKMVKQYKMIDADDIKSNEYGLSLIDMEEASIVITGHVERLDPNCNIVDDDVLLMKLDKNGLVAKAVRIDVDKDSDIGTSVLFRKKTKSILVAGETRTSLLCVDATTKPNRSKDLFLLETDAKIQNAKLEVFGCEMDENREVDVTLSNDDNAVILGNTKSFTSPQSTYLIERYDIVNERCYDKEVKVELVQIKFDVLTPKHEEQDSKYYEKKLVAEPVKLDQAIICKKED